jgi:hypothetical protein
VIPPHESRRRNVLKRHSRTLGQAAAISLDPTLRGLRWRWPRDDRFPRKDRAAGPCTLWSGSVRHVRALRVRPAGESLPRDEPLRVGNGLDLLADLLRQLDDDPLRAADVAEPIDVFVVLHLANELRATGTQASDDGVDVVDCECEMADARGVRRRVPGRRRGPTGRETSPARTVRGRPGSRPSRTPPGRPRAPPRGPPNRPRPAPRLHLESELDEELSRGCEVVNHDADVLHPLDRHVLDGMPFEREHRHVELVPDDAQRTHGLATGIGANKCLQAGAESTLGRDHSVTTTASPVTADSARRYEKPRRGGAFPRWAVLGSNQ